MWLKPGFTEALEFWFILIGDQCDATKSWQHLQTIWPKQLQVRQENCHNLCDDQESSREETCRDLCD